MRRLISLTFDAKLNRHWRQYVRQCVFATLTVFLMVLLLASQNKAILASIGASTFIVFAMPKSRAAKTRRLVGGHLIGLISGALLSLLPHASDVATAAVYALAVGSATVLMVITNTEHPPAAGTALGVAAIGLSWDTAISIIVSVGILAVIHVLFKSRMRDLV